MIDHILAFPNEAAAKAALPGRVYSDGSWNLSGLRPGIKIITAEAVWSGEGMERELVTPEQVLPGFWLAIALPALSAELRDLPNEACRLITDREAANSGAPFAEFTKYAAPSLDLVAVQTYRVSPVFAGSRYPFGL